MPLILFSASYPIPQIQIKKPEFLDLLGISLRINLTFPLVNQLIFIDLQEFILALIKRVLHPLVNDIKNRRLGWTLGMLRMTDVLIQADA